MPCVMSHSMATRFWLMQRAQPCRGIRGRWCLVSETGERGGGGGGEGDVFRRCRTRTQFGNRPRISDRRA